MLPSRRKSTKLLETPTAMPPKLENQGKSHDISPVLFMTVDGEPMRFFLCPGPAKVELLPLIKAGGGQVCKAQEPGAVLLVDPSDMVPLTGSTAHRYVSVQYIRDCIEKSEQLELEDYRMKSHDGADARSTRKWTAKSSSTRTSAGRIPYNSEEDAAIIRYVAKDKDRLKGNVLWQEMERSQVTTHTWQSMKYRYLHQLMHRAPEAQEEEGRRVPQGTENQETDVKGSPLDKRKASDEPSSDESTSSSLVQADEQQADDQHTDRLPTGARSSEPTNAEAPTAGAPHVPDVTPEEEDVDVDVEEEVDVKLELEEEMEVDVEEEAAAPQAVLAESPRCTSSPRRATPAPDASPISPHRRSFRLMMLPETPPSDAPSGKKARTSSPRSTPRASTSAVAATTTAAASAASPLATPPSSRRPPPPRTPRQPVEGSQSAVVPDGGADPGTQKGGKRKETRTLGILEMATKEFEDDSESDDEASTEPPQTADTRRPGGSTPKPPTGTPDAPPESRTAADAGSAPKPHLFIFDGESQEEGSQPADSEGAAVPAAKRVEKRKHVVEEERPADVHLEEDMERITALMKKTNQDLMTVTVALLKASGDFTTASAILLHPDSALGPFWTRHDDQLLLTSDPEVRRRLQKTYGERGVARRMAFLESL